MRQWNHLDLKICPKNVPVWSWRQDVYPALPTGSLGLGTLPLPTTLSPELFLLPYLHYLNSLNICHFQELFRNWEGQC